MLDTNATANSPTSSNNAMVMYNPSALTSIESYAKSLHASGLMPSQVKTWQATFAIITLGSELGIGAWQAINGIDVISNKPTIKPQLMLALIERSGKLEDLKIDGDDNQCTVTMKRVGRSPHTETFTMKDADRMMTSEWVNNQKREIPLSQKANWKSMPKQMLKWRAVSACARVVFGDVIMGLYTPDELADTTISINAQGEVVPTVDVTPNHHVVDTNLGKGNNRRIPADKPAQEPEAVEGEVIEVEPTPQPQSQKPNWPSASAVIAIVDKLNEKFSKLELNENELAKLVGCENALNESGWKKFATGKDVYNLAYDKIEALQKEAREEERATPAPQPAPQSNAKTLSPTDIMKLNMLLDGHGISDTKALQLLGLKGWEFDNINQAFLSARNAWLKAGLPFMTRKLIYTKNTNKSYVDYILGEYDGSSIKARAWSRQELRNLGAEWVTWVEEMQPGEHQLPAPVIVHYQADDDGNLKFVRFEEIPF